MPSEHTKCRSNSGSSSSLVIEFAFRRPLPTGASIGLPLESREYDRLCSHSTPDALDTYRVRYLEYQARVDAAERRRFACILVKPFNAYVFIQLIHLTLLLYCINNEHVRYRRVEGIVQTIQMHSPHKQFESCRYMAWKPAHWKVELPFQTIFRHHCEVC